jgi:hypothetical protein
MSLRNHILPISVFVAAAASGSTPISRMSMPLRTNISPIWMMLETIMQPPSNSISGSVRSENGPFTASSIRWSNSFVRTTSSMNVCARPSPIQISSVVNMTPNSTANISVARLLTTSLSASPRWLSAIFVPAMISDSVAAMKARYITRPCTNEIASLGMNVVSFSTIGIVSTRTQTVPMVPTMYPTAIFMISRMLNSKTAQKPENNTSTIAWITSVRHSFRLRMPQSEIITHP